ncbi:unnamed protein product [Cylindrotheca closterium]|uniref:Lysozyme n=1 Tax=Cylindrotheca closterium TaxID=2856 RepID=A0AAD2G4S5_9STRA|nr:unnamed protein product [Cylindrotheca closterium]
MRHFLLIASAFFTVVTEATEYKNVFGQPLQSCSSSGMALTGFTRNGHCMDRQDDIGSHHICIDMTSTTGGNFCSITGQPDWCSSYMPCHENSSAACPVQDWCVCQWAFASYIQKAGGCNAIQDIVCDAINMQAMVAYERQSADPRYKEAFDCIRTKCGIQ